jgi:AraC-like DNA-binding protein
MIDPLAEVVGLLQPQAPFSKIVNGAGFWRVRRSEDHGPFYCAIVDGSCQLTAGNQAPVILQSGDFALIPSVHGFTMSSLNPKSEEASSAPPVALPNGEFRIGEQTGPADVRMLIGYCAFGSPDADLLVSLLPRLVLARDEWRLSTLVRLVGEESRQARPARDVILSRLLEVLFIESLRFSSEKVTSPGLVRGLADPRLSSAIRRLHETPTKPWTVAQMANEAMLSRSAFFERFNRVMGVAPMEYLLAWRMALAKSLLRRHGGSVAEIAERVGYSSASTFSVAFTRFVGQTPARYKRQPLQST